MLEIKIIIEAPELSKAINNLSQALCSTKINTLSQITKEVNNTQISNTSASTPIHPTIPVNNIQTTQETSTINSAPEPNNPPATTNEIPVSNTVPVTSVPLAAAPEYTVDQIMEAGATLMDAGKIEELVKLLHSFGVQAVMDLKPEQYGAFVIAMKELGAKI